MGNSYAYSRRLQSIGKTLRSRGSCPQLKQFQSSITSDHMVAVDMLGPRGLPKLHVLTVSDGVVVELHAASSSSPHREWIETRIRMELCLMY